MKKPKDQRGGAGRNQGRKAKYPNGSETIRVPVELVEKVKKMLEAYMNNKKSL